MSYLHGEPDFWNRRYTAANAGYQLLADILLATGLANMRQKRKFDWPIRVPYSIE